MSERNVQRVFRHWGNPIVAQDEVGVDVPLPVVAVHLIGNVEDADAQRLL